MADRRGIKNPMWRGGRKRNRGYVYIYSPDHPHAVFRGHTKGYVAEHRLAVEKKLGRYLKPEERVHHIDGDPANNAPENLHLFVNDTVHLRWHKRLGEIAIYD